MIGLVRRGLSDLRRPRVAVSATLGVGFIAIAVDLILSGGPSAHYQPTAYVAIETTAALAGVTAAYLLLFRFRRSGRLDDLLLAIGLAILSVSNLVYGAIPSALMALGVRVHGARVFPPSAKGSAWVLGGRAGALSADYYRDF